MVGIKEFGKEYSPVNYTNEQFISFNSDGTYYEVLFGDLEIRGKWRFSNDSSKLAFEITEVDGQAKSDISLRNKIPTDSIILLTNDTLVYGSLGYYGKQKVYGHDDRYFIKVKD